MVHILCRGKWALINIRDGVLALMPGMSAHLLKMLGGLDLRLWWHRSRPCVLVVAAALPARVTLPFSHVIRVSNPPLDQLNKPYRPALLNPMTSTAEQNGIFQSRVGIFLRNHNKVC